MTKQQLKAIVKECLLEILQEGLGNSVANQKIVGANHPSSKKTNSLSMTQKKRTSPLDMPATPYGQKKSSLFAAIKAESRGNPIMASILADTARTTLPKMMSGGDSSIISESSRPGHSISQQEQFNGTPEQIFGEEVASKWSDLAFTDFSSKK